jgi:hypothetical protein
VQNPYSAASLLAEYELYDRSVDIVSAYEWLFTDTQDLPATVAHFERYPTVVHPDGRRATPDFTVLFTDQTAIVGEIANLPLAEQGVDSLCEQILRYDTLDVVPGAAGPQSVSVVDVLLLVPLDVGTDAVRRVLVERCDTPDHPYKPARRPTVMQFAGLPDKYVFQRRPDAINGTLYGGDRKPNYASFDDLKVRPDRFASIKVQRCFMNDPVPSLYMATTLWMKVWPSAVGGGPLEFDVDVTTTTRLLRRQYGVGRAPDVRRAMDILVAAGVARVTEADTWRVTRQGFRGQDADVHKVLAERVEKRPAAVVPALPRGRGRRGQATSPGPGQGSFFEPDNLPS